MPRAAAPKPSRGQATRERLVAAAVETFADRGYDAASTREIARAAGVEQGLLTYHFPTKDKLWRAAAERVFETLAGGLAERAAALSELEPAERGRALIRDYVRTMAAHPECYRFIADQGHRFDARTRWLVDTLIKPRFELLRELGVFGEAGIADEDIPHAFFALIGAAAFIFAVPANCRRLTGVDPRTRDAVEAHARFVAELLLPPS